MSDQTEVAATAAYREAEKAYSGWLAAFQQTDPYYAEEAFIAGFKAAAESRDQHIKELEEEGMAVVRLLQDIDTAGGFVTGLATELSDRIDAVLEGN